MTVPTAPNNLLEQAVQLAHTQRLTPTTRRGFKFNYLRTLVYHLSRLTKGAPFFLPQLKIADLTGIGYETVGRAITNLVNDGILSVSHTKGRTTFYTFTDKSARLA